MPEEEEDESQGRFDSLKDFFSKIGRGVQRTGQVTTGAPKSVREAVKSEPETTEEEPSSLSDRLQELKQMEVEGTGPSETEWDEEEIREEEEEWEEEREELSRPASERFADIFSGVFMGPASRLAGYFTDLEEDLYKANMNITPERYITFLLGVSTIVAIASFLFIWFLLGSFLFMAIIPPLTFMLTLFVGRRRPKSKIASRASEVNQEIPYVLRHMATQLSSGIGLPESMTSVSKADYGVLSEEFNKTLQDMRTGESMNDALAMMRYRVESDSLTRAVRQIQRTLRTGGNLSRALGILADEAAFDLRMNLRDYTQSLNMMSMVYMFAAAVIPPLLLVVFIIAKFMGGASFPPAMVAILYLLGIPMLLGYMVLVFKRMEPEV